MSKPGSVGEALGAAIDALRAAGVEDPRLDAEVMLAEVAGIDRARMIARPETPLEGAAGRRFGEMVRRRLRREPVAYILGRRWFRHLELRCDRPALIPRPETELLVEVALDLGDRLIEEGKIPPTEGASEAAAGSASVPGLPRVLDIGTGSGAVALAIAAERPGWRVRATDTSADALALARENAALLELKDRVDFHEGTIPSVAAPVDLVVANLPYIPDGDWPSLSPEIRGFEPREALLAGGDGLDAIREVVSQVVATLAGGKDAGSSDPAYPGSPSRQIPPIALEIGAGQATAVADILRLAGWSRTETHRDLAGIKRVVVGLGA